MSSPRRFPTAAVLLISASLLVGAPVISLAQQVTAPPETALPSLAPLVKIVLPSVVNISVTGTTAAETNPLANDPFFRKFFNIPDQPQKRPFAAAGSGVIIDAAKGYVVTNNHVIDNAEKIVVTLSNGKSLTGKLLGTDPATDVAVVQVPAEGLKAIEIANSDALQVGDYVVAVGNPFGLGQTVTSGIVSALGRTGLGIEGYEDFIQTDASVNPGNSGGALVDLAGRLVGINTAIVGPSGGSVGIGFAIPANMVRDLMNQIVRYGDVKRGQLGVIIQDLTPELADAMKLPASATGALVSEVQHGSAAEQAGIKAQDLIVAVDGHAVAGASALRNRIGLMREATPVDVTLLRDGKTMDVKVTLGAAVTTTAGADLSPLLDGAAFEPAQAAYGVAVQSVAAGSRAEAGGLHKGDIIVSVNGAAIRSLDDFSTAVQASPDHLQLNVVRQGTLLALDLS